MAFVVSKSKTYIGTATTTPAALDFGADVSLGFGTLIVANTQAAGGNNLIFKYHSAGSGDTGARDAVITLQPGQSETLDVVRIAVNPTIESSATTVTYVVAWNVGRTQEVVG